MVNCAVAYCKNSSVKSRKSKDGITFHRFPQDEQRRKMWEVAVNRSAEWSSTYTSAVCSQHFNAKDFYFTDSRLRRLLPTAVPAINMSPCNYKQPTISDGDPVDYIDSTNTEEVVLLKNKVRRLEIIAANRKKQIILMWQSKKRMQRKIDKMKLMIEHLVQNRDENKVSKKMVMNS